MNQLSSTLNLINHAKNNDNNESLLSSQNTRVIKSNMLFNKRISLNEEENDFYSTPVKKTIQAYQYKSSSRNRQEVSVSSTYSNNKIYKDNSIEESNKTNRIKTKNDVVLLSSYRHFKLTKRKTPSHLISSKQITHFLLPHEEKNNSIYKNKLISYIKRKNVLSNELALSSTKLVIKSSINNRNNSNKLESRDSSHKLKYIKLEDDEGLKQRFLFFKDYDIGFTPFWQRNLIKTCMDDDVYTDDDQLKSATRHIRNELKESIMNMTHNINNNIRNTQRFKDIIPCSNVMFVMEN